MKQALFLFITVLILPAFLRAQTSNVLSNASLPEAKQQKLLELTQKQDVLNSSLSDKAYSPSDDIGDAPGYAWIKQFGKTSIDKITCINTDAAGNIYLSGEFSGNLNIQGNTFTATGLKNGFIMKLDTSGNYRWFQSIVSDELSRSKINALNIDASGNIFLTGYYEGEAEFGGISLPYGNFNALLAKISNDGNVLMATMHSENWEETAGTDILADNNGDILVLLRSQPGSFYGESKLLKYTENGTMIDSTSISPNLNIHQLHGLDDSYLMTGMLTGELTTPDTTYVGTGYGNTLALQVDEDFNITWAVMPNGSEQNGAHLSTTDEQGNIYFTGYASTPITFENQTLQPGYYVCKCNPGATFDWALQLDALPDCLGVNDNLLLGTKGTVKTYSKTGLLLNTWPFDHNISQLYGMTEEEYIMVSANTQDNFIQGMNADSQNWITQTEGTFNNALVYETIDDNDNAIYSLGYIAGNIEYYDYNGDPTHFLAKHNANGDLIWFFELPLELMFDEGINDIHQLAISPDGEYVYFVAGFDEEIEIGGETFVPETEGLSTEPNNVFFAKISKDGAFTWGQNQTSPFYFQSIAASPEKVFVAGLFQTPITVSGNDLDAYNDLYIACYDQNGNFNWIEAAGGNVVAYVSLISTDPDNNLYVSSEFMGTGDVYFVDTTLTATEADGHVYFAKMSAEGGLLWLHRYGADVNPSPMGNNQATFPTDMQTTEEGITYMKGFHGHNVAFGDIILTIPNTDYFGVSNFFGKFDQDGDPVWISSLQGAQYATDFNEMDIDSEGSLYLGAFFRDSIKLGNEYVTPSDQYALFVAKYLTNGDFGWARTMELDESGSIHSVSVLDTNAIFVNGAFHHFLQADNYQLATAAETGFLAKLGGWNTGIVEPEAGLAFELSPNPASQQVTIQLDVNGEKEIGLYDINGKLLMEKTTPATKTALDVHELPAGVYILKLTSNEGYGARKIIIQ